jgi:hypothetical protein
MRILEGLDKFLKSLRCFRNTLIIKNILIISIFFSFSTKTLSNKFKISLFHSPPLPSKLPDKALSFDCEFGGEGFGKKKKKIKGRNKWNE